MRPTGDELKRLFSAQQPAADFTARVMEQVRAERRVRKFPFKRWSIAGAIAASLTVGIYVRHQRRVVQPAPTLEAQQAEEQLLHMLQIAGYNVHKAREAVLQPRTEDSE